MKDKAIIIDIDGTLADPSHRIVNGKCDHTKAHLDPVKPAVEKIIEKFSSEYRIILFTARPEHWRGPTLKWLEEKQIGFDYLFMRGDEDHRPDYICKYDMYKRYIEGTYEVLFCLDDNNKVVEMLRDIGLICLQVKNTEY